MFTITPTVNTQVETWLRRIDNAQGRLQRLETKRQRNGSLTQQQTEKEFKNLAKIDRLTGRLPQDSMTVIADAETGTWSYQVVDSPFDDTITGGTYWIRSYGSTRCSELPEEQWRNAPCSRRSSGGIAARVDIEDGETYTVTSAWMSSIMQERMSWEDSGFYLETYGTGQYGEGDRSAWFFTPANVSGFYDHPTELAG